MCVFDLVCFESIVGRSVGLRLSSFVIKKGVVVGVGGVRKYIFFDAAHTHTESKDG